ncbi:MAG: DUF4422 domain-containing protein [Clostridiales bacterium]|nr:DUF4422 domain-containing protein [Clostridiales bacterium]
MNRAINYQETEQQLNKLLQELRQYDQLYLYGAGNRARAILQMCKKNFLTNLSLKGFIITSTQGNREYSDAPTALDGRPVVSVSEYYDREEAGFEQAAVLVTVMEHYHEEIRRELVRTPFRHIYYLTDAMERLLTDGYVEQRFKQLELPYAFTGRASEDRYGSEKAKRLVRVFRVQSAADVSLTQELPEASYVVPIQAGVRLTGSRICDVTDGDGMNISEQNSYYNELSCLYWLWKNTDYPYSGICHYRRMFESDIALRPIMEGKADVILPSPTVVWPDLQGYYLGWGLRAYYEEMLSVIEQQFPEYYDTALWCAENEIFIPNNICIASRKELERYCSFLFGVVFEVEERMRAKEGPKQKRCWLSEHVSTVYFIHCLKHSETGKIYFSDIVRYW